MTNGTLIAPGSNCTEYVFGFYAYVILDAFYLDILIRNYFIKTKFTRFSRNLYFGVTNVGFVEMKVNEFNKLFL